MTNDIGAGMTNVAVPLVSTEAQLLGRAAFSLGISRVELVRKAMLLGLQQMNSALAAQVQAAREERMRFKHGVVCLVAGLLVVFCSADMRATRCARSVRRGRDGFELVEAV